MMILFLLIGNYPQKKSVILINSLVINNIKRYPQCIIMTSPNTPTKDMIIAELTDALKEAR